MVRMEQESSRSPQLQGDIALLSYSARFRSAVLKGASSSRMCAALSGPLHAALQAKGVDCSLEESTLPLCNHVFLRLADGRALDVTADQFDTGGGARVPAVYLGRGLEVHRGARPWLGGGEWNALMQELGRLVLGLDPGWVGETVSVVLRSLPAELVEFAAGDAV